MASTLTAQPKLTEETKRSGLSWQTIAFWLVMALAVSMRVVGIQWGLPGTTHVGSYHPDENLIVNTSLGMVARHTLLPHWYVYGSLQLYLISLGTSVLSLMRGDEVPIVQSYLAGRLIACLMGIATVWIVYRIGTQAWGTTAGVIAAAILAVAPLHAQHSHYLTVDVPATFWVSLSTYWLVVSLKAERPSGRDLMFAAACAGFATATKYNAGLMVLSVVYACWSSGGAGSDSRARLLLTARACLAFSVAFVVGCPGVIFDFSRFVSDIHSQAAVVMTPSNSPVFEAFANTGSGFVYHLVTNLRYGLGLPSLMLALAGCVVAFRKGDRVDRCTGIFVVAYYILVSLAALRFARYDLPLYPALCLWAGRAVAMGCQDPSIRRRTASQMLTAVAIVCSTVSACAIVFPMASADPRDKAYSWLQSHQLATAPIGYARVPWFQTPPVEPAFTGLWYDWQHIGDQIPDWQSQIIYHGKDWDSSILVADKPQVVLLSEFDYRDALRLHNASAQRFLDILHQSYRVGAEFGGEQGAAISPPGLPHDMIYPNPATWIFIRR